MLKESKILWLAAITAGTGIIFYLLYKIYIFFLEHKTEIIITLFALMFVLAAILIIEEIAKRQKANKKEKIIFDRYKRALSLFELEHGNYTNDDLDFRLKHLKALSIYRKSSEEEKTENYKMHYNNIKRYEKTIRAQTAITNKFFKNHKNSAE
jgi:hypothetical protein